MTPLSPWQPRTDSRTGLVYRSLFTSAAPDLRSRSAELFAAWAAGKNAPISAAALLAGAAAESEAEGVRRVVRGTIGTYADKQSGRSLSGAVFRLDEFLADGSAWTTALRIAVPSHAEQVSLFPGGTEHPETLFDISPEAGPWPEKPWIWLDLEHHRGAGAAPIRPGSPRLIRDLLAAVEGTDASLPLTSDVLDIAENHVDELCGWLFDPARRVPIIVFSPDPQASDDQQRFAVRLARDVTGVAVVVRLSSTPTAAAFSRRVGPHLHVYGGGMRTYLPGLVQHDPFPRRHRVLSAATMRALGARSANAVRDQVLALSTRRTPPGSYALLRRALSRRALDRAVQGRGPASPPGPQPALFPAPHEPAPLPGLETAKTPLSAETAEGNRLLRATLTLAGIDPSAVPLVTDPAGIGELERERRCLQDLLLRTVHARAVPEPAPAEISARLAEADDEITMLYSEIDDLTARLSEVQEIRDERDIADLEIAELERNTERQQARIRWLESELAANHVHVTGQPTPGEPILPTSIIEALDLAAEHLPYLAIGRTSDAAAGLEVHPQAEKWAIKVWQALTALNAYAEARVNGLWTNSFLAWCHEPPSSSSAVPSTWIALSESETTNSMPKLRDARVFAVPKQVDAAGKVYMPAHIKIQQGGTPCPRIHFHDDTGGKTARVHVGYVGDHLPTASFR